MGDDHVAALDRQLEVGLVDEQSLGLCPAPEQHQCVSGVGDRPDPEGLRCAQPARLLAGFERQGEGGFGLAVPDEDAGECAPAASGAGRGRPATDQDRAGYRLGHVAHHGRGLGRVRMDGLPRSGHRRRWSAARPGAGSMGQYWGMRIVSLLPSATEIVYALGLAEHLVGVTHECDWPPEARTVRVVSPSALPAAAEPAEVDRLVSASIGDGQPIYRLDTDAIRDLRPDLVLAQDLCAVCAVPSGHVNQALDVLGCQAEVVSLDPSSLDEVLNCVLQVGNAAGVRERAGQVVAGLRDRLTSVQAAVDGLQRPGCSRWSGAIRRSTAGTGCRRCWRSPVQRRCLPARVLPRCG